MSRTIGSLPSVTRVAQWGVVAGLLLVPPGCGGTDSPSTPQDPDPPVPAAITLSASSLEFASLGETVSVSATVTDQYGAPMATPTVAWSSSDSQVASVSSVGVVEAAANGFATVTASAGTVSAAVGVTVQQVVVSIRPLDPVVTVSMADGSLALEVIAEDANGYPAPLGSINWTSSHPGTVTIDASGYVTGLSPGWAIVLAAVPSASCNTIIHVVSPGFPAPSQAMRALHLGGNWLGNQLHSGVPHEEYLEFVESLDVNWVGISVALHHGESTDPTVFRVYDGDVIRTFTDEVLRAVIREFVSRGIEVYVTLAFETEPESGSGIPERWMLGLPWSPDGFGAEEWPWRPGHLDHANFVAQFWSSYTDQAVHFARIAEEEGASLFSLGTETDHLFRTRIEGQWVTEFGDEIRTMVTEVRKVFTGLVTYDQLVWVLLEPDVYGATHPLLWEDGGFDVIGLSAWFELVEDLPGSIMSVAELQEAWEPVFTGLLQPLQQANPGRPILFTEFGFVDDIRAPADPSIDTYAAKVFLDLNDNGLDDGQEVQANIIEAFYRTLHTYPVVQGTFWWDHAMDSDADVEALAHLLSHNFRGKLAEDVVRLAYRGS
ncbi:MAG: hypothetical protein ABIF09_11125, partial [Gemmatimonadota bacterium]